MTISAFSVLPLISLQIYNRISFKTIFPYPAPLKLVKNWLTLHLLLDARMAHGDMGGGGVSKQPVMCIDEILRKYIFFMNMKAERINWHLRLSELEEARNLAAHGVHHCCPGHCGTYGFTRMRQSNFQSFNTVGMPRRKPRRVNGGKSC